MAANSHPQTGGRRRRQLSRLRIQQNYLSRDRHGPNSSSAQYAQWREAGLTENSCAHRRDENMDKRNEQPESVDVAGDSYFFLNNLWYCVNVVASDDDLSPEEECVRRTTDTSSSSRPSQKDNPSSPSLTGCWTSPTSTQRDRERGNLKSCDSVQCMNQHFNNLQLADQFWAAYESPEESRHLQTNRIASPEIKRHEGWIDSARSPPYPSPTICTPCYDSMDNGWSSDITAHLSPGYCTPNSITKNQHLPSKNVVGSSKCRSYKCAFKREHSTQQTVPTKRTYHKTPAARVNRKLRTLISQFNHLHRRTLVENDYLSRQS